MVKGFTFAELLIIIAIMGVLATIAIPAFSVWLPNYRLRSAGRDLFSTLQVAKLKAIRANSEYEVTFNIGGNRYSLVSGGPDRDCATTGDNKTERTLRLADYGSEIRYGTGNATKKWDGSGLPANNKSSYTSDKTQFNARGMVAFYGYVFLENSKETRCYAVGTANNGMIYIRYWTGSSWR